MVTHCVLLATHYFSPVDHSLLISSPRTAAENDVRLIVTFDDGFDESGDYRDINFLTSRQTSKGWKQYDKHGFVEGVTQVPHSVVIKKEDLKEGMRGYAR